MTIKIVGQFGTNDVYISSTVFICLNDRQNLIVDKDLRIMKWFNNWKPPPLVLCQHINVISDPYDGLIDWLIDSIY